MPTSPTTSAGPRLGAAPRAWRGRRPGRRAMLALLLGGALAVAAAALQPRPTYRAEALLRIDGPVELGPDAGAPAGVAETLALLRARPVLEEAVRTAALDLDAHPRRAPLVGAVAAALWGGPGPAPAPPGLERFGWGGERIAVTALEVPPRLAGAPLVLTALGDERFRLAGPDGEPLATGAVGERTGTAGEDGRAEILVTELVARPGTEFLVTRERRGAARERLARGIEAAPVGRRAGLVAVTLVGSSPDRLAAALDAICAAYLRLGAEHEAARAARVRARIEARLAEASARAGCAEVTAPGGPAAVASAGPPVGVERVRGDRSPVQLVPQSFTPARPRRASIPPPAPPVAPRQADCRALEPLRAAELPLAAADAGRATLLERASTLEVPAARPRLPLVLGLGAVLALGAALGGLLRPGPGGEPARGLEDAGGAPLLAAIQRSRAEAGLCRRARRAVPSRPATLALIRPGDPAVEDLRILRTALLAALAGARSRVVVATGPAPGEGVSFVCANLGLLLARARRRVLVVDADLRAGGLHLRLGVPAGPGLAEALAGAAPLEAAIHRTGTPQLDVLPAGRRPAPSAELLAGPELEALLAQAAQRYDVVLVDTPAALGFADAGLVARCAGLSLLVLRDGRRRAAEVEEAARGLARAGVALSGLVLNDVPPGRRAGR